MQNQADLAWLLSGPSRMISAMIPVQACQLPQSGRHAMAHAGIVVAFCDDRTIKWQLGGASWTA